MRNNYDFEQLVFEKAGAIKAHDRRRKIVVSTVTPLAAALVILTAAGLRSLSFMQSNSADHQDAAGAAIGDLYSENAPKPSDDHFPIDVQENQEDYALYDNTVQENADYIEEDAEQYSEDAQNDTVGAKASINAASIADEKNSASLPDASHHTVIFRANETIVLNGDAAEDIINSLSKSSVNEYENENGNSSYLGTIYIDNDVYTIFYDHVNVQKYEGDSGAFALDDETKNILEKYLPINFG